MMKKIIATCAALLLAASAALTGCGATASGNGTALASTGILTLSVNPEIQIEYNKDGVVTALTGKNDDGKAIVTSYTDYIGKDCGTVLEELVRSIHEAGYFVEDVDGNKKNIVLQLEPGSVLPDDDFLQAMSSRTQTAVKDLSLSSGIVTIDNDDYDGRYAKDGAASHYITLEKAREIALTQAGVNAGDAVFKEREFDFDDGIAVFELEFTAGGIEYDYDIDAQTGKVLKAEHSAADLDDDDNGRGGSQTAASTGSRFISLEKAREIALSHAGVNAANAVFDDKEFDLDDGTPVYELEFAANGREYEYDIHAETGSILEAEQSSDDNDDNDDDDNDDNDNDDDDHDDDDNDDDGHDDDDHDDRD